MSKKKSIYDSGTTKGSAPRTSDRKRYEDALADGTLSSGDKNFIAKAVDKDWRPNLNTTEGKIMVNVVKSMDKEKLVEVNIFPDEKNAFHFETCSNQLQRSLPLHGMV